MQGPLKLMQQSFTITIKTLSFFLAGGLFLVSILGCQSLLYYPRAEKLFDPGKVNLVPEDIYFKSGPDTLHAWYFKSKTHENKGTVLFFHGNAENLTSHFLMLRWLPENGYNYLIFDYPGYGTSSGKPTPESTLASGIAAADWLMQNKQPDNLIMYGQSLGGIIALRTAEEIYQRIPLRNIIIEASFSSYQGVARRILARNWITWLLQPLSYVVLSDTHAPKNIAQLSPTPLLFITGDRDPVIDQENSLELLRLAQNPKDLWIIPGGAHGNLYEVNEGQLRGRLLQYLSDVPKSK